jgi:hypothetical protein
VTDDDGTGHADGVQRGERVGDHRLRVVGPVRAVAVPVAALVQGEDRQTGQPGHHEVPEPAGRSQPVQQQDRRAAARPAGGPEPDVGAGQVDVEPAERRG